VATVPPPLRDDNGSGFIRCTKCGFEVPHACVAGRGGTRIDVQEWLSLCQELEAANGKPHQCPRLLEEPNWPTRRMDLGPDDYVSQSTSIPDENVLVALDASKLRMLDEWIATLPEPKPSRAEGIQRLVELGVRYRLEKLITF
jgi:hypothetical protein